MMIRLGYELTTEEPARAALAESRASRRRAGERDWLQLPESMGITVRQGEVPGSWRVPSAPALDSGDPETAPVTFNGGSGLLVEHGREVTVAWQPDPDLPDADPSWLVQGWAVTLAMLQRGQLSLHAATVQIGDQVVAIAGHRGAGKSTTSMALRKRGHRLLVDDVTLIEFRDGGAWTTLPRNVHLLSDAAAAVGVDFSALQLLSGGRAKVAFRAEAPDEEPHHIDRIIVLAPNNQTTEVALTPATAASAWRR